MRLSKGKSLKIEIQEDSSLKLTPVPQDSQDSEETKKPTLDYDKRCRR
jgi:hypothetical protein